MRLEHATYPRRREETLPEPRVLYPRRQILEDLRGSGERLVRLVDLPAPLVQLTDPASDLPQFVWQPDLLGESFGFSQPTQGSLGVAFPLVEERQGAKVGHPIPPVVSCAFGEASYLFSGEVFISPAQQRLDLVVKKETELRLEEGAEFVCLSGMGVGILPGQCLESCGFGFPD